MASNEQYCLFLSGDLLLPDGQVADPEALLALLDADGKIAAERCNGSFSIQVIRRSDERIEIYTDPFNSRKVFYAENGAGSLRYASSLHLLDHSSRALDLAGIGSYLANGVIYGNRTVFVGIRTLPAATRWTDTVGEGHMTNRARPQVQGKDKSEANKYWEYRITSANAGVPERELLDAYKDLLVRSVEVRSRHQDHNFISISGGYDSAGIAGIMQLLGRENVSCFSYVYGEAKPGTDAFVARELAAAAGYPHRIVQSYRGDLMKTVLTNGRLGEGLANFCDEIDIWEELRPVIGQFGNPSLFAGDMYYLPNVQPQSRADAIVAVGIHPPDILRFYTRFSAGKVFNEVQDGWGREYAGIVAAAPQYQDHKDLKDHLYVNHRVPHTLMVWREMIQMAQLPVANPFLDRELMEFVMALPVEMRDGKALYIKALTELSPHLFLQRRARENNVKPDWSGEFKSNRQQIVDWVGRTSSRMDEIFPPSGIRELLAAHEQNAFSLTDFVGRAGRSIRYRYPGTNKFISRFVPLPPKELGTVIMLKRLLVLRAFLLDDE